MSLVEDLLSEWRANGERWEAVAGKARAAGLEVWNPARYALSTYGEFLRRYPPRKGAVMGVGLNPGPYGMAQTGIPFTDCRTARDKLGLAMEIPGWAPEDLAGRLRKDNGKWRQTYERSSLGIYAFLEEAWGPVEKALENWWVGNPCPLLFLDPDTWNVTPADGRLRRIDGMQELRVEAVRRFARVLKPRGIVLLGKDVQSIAGETARELVGDAGVVDYRHPAREPPRKWAQGLAERLGRQGLR